MSIGIIGTTTQTLKIANKVQKVNKVHTYDVSHTVNMFNAQNYLCIADLMVNMDRPRTVFTTSPKSLLQILEWSDPEDTVVNCTLEHFDRSLFYENQCSEKSVHYLSTSLTNDALLVGGKKRIFSTHEPLFYAVAKNVQHAGDMPGSGHFAKMVLDSLECAMFQSVGDAFAYSNGNIPVMLSLMDKAMHMDITGPVIERSKSQLYVTRNYLDVAQTKNTTSWFMEYAFKTRTPTPVVHAAINARTSSQYAKFSETTQKYNKFNDSSVILQTIRFCYAMAYYECRQLSNGKITKWVQNSNAACPMFEIHDPMTIMDKTVEYVRSFVMHCVHCGVPVPTVQAALSQYDFMKQERTSMNFIASLRNV